MKFQGLRPRIQTLMQQARRGDPQAQYMVGMAYATGDRVPLNNDMAAMYFRKAAAQGVAEAAVNVGLLMLQGLVAARDFNTALSYINGASRQIALDADTNYTIGLALLGEDGDGTPPSAKRDQWAAHYFGLAAEESHVQSQYEIGRLFLSGRGVEQDAEKAASWVSAAANQGSLDAQFLMGTLLQNGTGLEQNFEWAEYWFTQAAKSGHAPACEVVKNGYDPSALALLESVKLGFAAQPDDKGRKAFLQSVRKQHHPDKGGDASIFRWAQAQWEETFR